MKFQYFREQIPDQYGVSIASIHRIAAIAMIASSESLNVLAALSGHWHYSSRASEVAIMGTRLVKKARRYPIVLTYEWDRFQCCERLQIQANQRRRSPAPACEG